MVKQQSLTTFDVKLTPMGTAVSSVDICRVLTRYLPCPYPISVLHHSTENSYKLMRTFTDKQNTRGKQELTIPCTQRVGLYPSRQQKSLKKQCYLSSA